jgi:hypothetical protein
MKRFSWIIVGCLLVTFCLTAVGQRAGAQLSYPGIYWILGSVQDPEGVGAEGRWVVFYKDDPAAGFADDHVGTVGLSRRTGQYILNSIEDLRMVVSPGEYKVAIVTSDVDNYGADPVNVTVTGHGYDVAPDLVLAYGAGIAPPGRPGEEEPPPLIKVWFGNRLYQPSIFGLEEGKSRFYVAEEGNLKVEVSIADPYQLDREASYSMSIQGPEGAVDSFDLSGVPGFVASAAEARPFVIETPYPAALAGGDEDRDYVFTFNARSAGTLGPATSVATVAAVTVYGGPVKLVGVPLTYPSPVHLKTDKQVTFQYTLTGAANIDIFLFDVSGRVVRKITLNRDEEGGAPGVNKVGWDLMTDQGTLVSSGIYVFTLVNRDDGKLLGRGKFTCLP